MKAVTQYFGLKTNPFTKEVAGTDLFESKDLRELASRLEFMKQTRGFFLLTADAGVGKTTALRRFAESLNPALHRVCYCPLASLNVMDFYREMVIRMGAAPEYRKILMFEQFQSLVTASHHDKRITPVFILDEAQSLAGGVLEDIRMLFNFRMDSENPFILILAGHHTIRMKLQMAAHQALRQRFVGNYHMEGLSREETALYLSSRMKLAGATDPGLFSDAAAECIHAQSNGSPRIVNTIADAALKLAALKETRTIDGDTIYQAARDIEI
jgi:type II secretory pathway predicted ATPase ExeA